MELRGQGALVTGAASGIGAETARYLADAGARVALLDINTAGVEAVAKEVHGIALPCDVADSAAVELALKRVREAHGPPRILINCAAVATTMRIIDRSGPMSLEDFRKAVDVNLVGTFNMVRLVAADLVKLPVMAHGERGVIISTASVDVFEGQIGHAAYAASKAGVAAMTLPAARELGQYGIRVMAIAPGLFNSPLLYQLEMDLDSSMIAKTPFPSRLGDPAEFAKLVLHIIDNMMLNGTVIRLDGGLRLPAS